PSLAKPTTRLLAPDLHRGLLMAIMAMDHLALGINTWQHGTNIDGETDGIIVRRWNFTTAYIIRTFTHFCAPGFMFLLGMGVVFLSKSRTRLGWSASRMLQYYAMRGFVLTAVTVLWGVLWSGGQLWFMNMVLFALGLNYFLAGILWLSMNQTENRLADRTGAAYGRLNDDGDDEQGGVNQPLLQGRGPARESERAATASSLSWHIHNTILAILSVITIWWNIWLSDNHGHCSIETESPDGTPRNSFLGIWFWPVMTEHVMSNFPPLAWLSFAILGLLYGRILSARKWTTSAIVMGHVAMGVVFSIIFVATRLLRIGNLSEDCLHTPAQHHHTTNENPYLASPASFFYIIKYPPDVAFWAFTMAGNLFALAAFSAIPARIAQRFSLLLSYGTSSLFFYVVHICIVMSPVGQLMIRIFGQETDHASPTDPENFKGVTNLFIYFAIWLTLLLIMWPACHYYSRFKSTKHADSLWRFF
ncbi:hypothetical protein TRIATDRAFT_175301, partial [Trichoderma atroviride IMI 206040]